jgi:hypothetical protein
VELEATGLPLPHRREGCTWPTLCPIDAEVLSAQVVTVLRRWTSPVVFVFMLGFSGANAIVTLIRRWTYPVVIVFMLGISGAKVIVTAKRWLTYPVVFVFSMLGFSVANGFVLELCP